MKTRLTLFSNTQTYVTEEPACCFIILLEIEQGGDLNNMSDQPNTSTCKMISTQKNIIGHNTKTWNTLCPESVRRARLLVGEKQ